MKTLFAKSFRWMTGHRSRADYWSCSKLADRLRAKSGVTEKPGAATSEEWDSWHKANTGKWGYWLAEEGLDILQDIWMFIPDVYRNIRYYIRNRFIDKTHYLDTKLKKGSFHEMETRLLHGMFEALVDFVEYEKANMQRWSSDEKFKLPNKAAGLAYLGWEISLKDEGVGEAVHVAHVRQSEAAKETLALYYWWKYTRPLRKEPGEAVGLWEFQKAMRDKYCEDGDNIWGILGRSKDYTAEEQAENDRLFQASNDEEVRQYNEDTEMMIRLVNLRNTLWT